MKKERRGEYTKKRRKRFLFLKNTNQYANWLKQRAGVVATPPLTHDFNALTSPTNDFQGISSINMSKFSLTYIGVIISVLSYLAEILNVNVVKSDIEITIATIMLFVGAIIALIGRYRKGDITWFGKKKA